MLGLSGNPLSIMCCLISIRLSLPESVKGDLSMNCVKRMCMEKGKIELFSEVGEEVDSVYKEK